MYIKVNTSTLQNQTAHIGSSINDFSKGVSNAKLHVSDISKVWQGNDYNNFLLKMQDFMEELSQLEKAMQSFNNYIKDGYLNAVTKLDNYYGRKKILIK